MLVEAVAVEYTEVCRENRMGLHKDFHKELHKDQHKVECMDQNKERHKDLY